MDSDTLLTVRQYTNNANSIAWDECHKIYILMDAHQTRLMRDWDYNPLTSDQTTGAERFDTIMQWYKESCSLRFIYAVETSDTGDENFIKIVSQGEDE